MIKHNRPLAKLYINHYNKEIKYRDAKNLSDREFRRNVGIKRDTFERMLKIISVAFVLLLVQEKLTILIYLKDQNYP